MGNHQNRAKVINDQTACQKRCRVSTLTVANREPIARSIGNTGFGLKSEKTE